MLSITRTATKIPRLTQKIDYYTVLSLKHAFNLYVDDEKLVKNSVKNKNSDYDDEIEWLNKKSIQHALNYYK